MTSFKLFNHLNVLKKLNKKDKRKQTRNLSVARHCALLYVSTSIGEILLDFTFPLRIRTQCDDTA